MEYVVKMDSGAMIYMLNFIKSVSGIQKFKGVGVRDRQAARRSLKQTLIILKKKQEM
jgi:hypothetical protein